MKEVITVKDIQEMFGVGYNKACGYIAAIKKVSDTLGARGKVHRQDYELWLEAKKGHTAEFKKGVGYV